MSDPLIAGAPEQFDPMLAEGKLARQLKTNSDRMIRAWRAFEEECGGRSKLAEGLDFSGDPRGEFFASCLRSAALAKRTLYYVALGCKVDARLARQLFIHGLQEKNRFDVQRSKQAALDAGIEHVGKVVGDIAAYSVAQEVPCKQCCGTGSVRVEEGEQGTQVIGCFMCSGTGKLMKAADIKKQELFLRTMGVIEEGGGVNIQTNVTQQMAMAVASVPRMEDVVRAGRGRTIEAEGQE